MATAARSRRSKRSVQEYQREWKSNDAAARSPPSKRNCATGIPMSWACYWHWRTGMPNCVSSKNKGPNMMKVRQRIDRLEEEILPPDDGPPEILTICFVNANKETVSTLEYPLSNVRPSNARGRRNNWDWRRGRNR